MAREQNISQDLYDLLVSRGWEPESTDAQGQPSQPQEATIFTFDYVSRSGQNYGTAVVVLDDDGDLQLYYGDNLGRGMEEQDKDEWFGFLQQMKQFATRHDFHTFSPRNLNQLKHTMAGMAAIKEGLFESYYGNRTVSYSGAPTEARLMIRHRRPLGEADARYRYVESLFIETQEGERWKLPFRMLSGGRAMLEHVRQGGRPYDVRGVHISELVEEINVLSRFRRATQGRVVEGVAQGLVEQATQYLGSARATLKGLASGRGYRAYFESWSPADIADTEALVEEVKGLFVETTLDARIEAALPLLSRLKGQTMREADIFENWIDQVAEGTWSTPDTPDARKKLEQLMSQELPVGPDAANAIEQLYDIFGDDALFDRLHDLAERDPDADARFEIHSRAQELGIELPEPPMPEPAQQDLTRQPAPGKTDDEQVDEASAPEVNVDRVLEILRATFSRLNSEGAWSPEAKVEFADMYKDLRHHLMRGDWEAAKADLMMTGARKPDLFDAFTGAMWEAAGLPNNATWEEFESAVSGAVDEGDNLATFVGPNESQTRDIPEFTVGDEVIMRDPNRSTYGQRGVVKRIDGDEIYVGGPFLMTLPYRKAVVQLINQKTPLAVPEDSTDAMDHRGAVTDSFYEDLARIKRLALSK